MELYSQNVSFEAILRNCILKIFPSRQLSGVVLYKSLFEAILRNCILKIFTVRQLSGVLSPHFVLKQFLWRILRNCILKIFLLRQFYWIVFLKHFLWDNSAELYSQNTFFEAILLNCILKTFPFEAIPRNCILTLSLLGQLCRVAFLQMSEDIISPCE